ncbi:MAG: cell division protein SepF [Lachnospiraceae bacterium]|nr:cell division protein SepF [Lachnospiraceae bacterium]
MSALDKFLNFMRLDPDDSDEDDLPFDDDFEDEKPAKKERTHEAARPVAVKEKAPKITPMKPSKRQGASGMEVCVIKPTSVEDAREITETLLSNRTVVLNVEGLDVDIAQRIIDFTSGSCFAISGNLQKITNYIFIITPAAVDISGDFQGILEGLSSNTFI